MKNSKNLSILFAAMFCFSFSVFAQNFDATGASKAQNAYLILDANGSPTADANHDKWIDVLNIDWGSHKPGGGMTGQSRRRGGAVVEDVTLTIEYEKASPKLQEKMNMGEVIPKLEIEQTSTYGGARAVYLKYELKNVLITSINVHPRKPLAKIGMRPQAIRRIR